MKKCSLALCGVLLAASPVTAADDSRTTFSLGYAFMRGSEDGFSLTFPLGVYASLSRCVSSRVGLELDLGLHHHFEDDRTVAGTQFNAVAGPRLEFGGSEKASPYVHVLGGLAHIAGNNSNTNPTFMAGGGVDVKLNGKSIRLGGDYQFISESGITTNIVRLIVGLTF